MIYKTKDYSIFKKHECNRELDNGNLRKIENSIRFKNKLEAKPILVNARMEIIDGQHRLEVAKKLDLDIYYTIDSNAEDQDMILLNNNQMKWSLHDYNNFYEKQGNINYIRLKRFMKEVGIDKENMALILFIGSGGAAMEKFRVGGFIMPDDLEEKATLWRNAQACKTMISNSVFKKHNFTNSQKFLRALLLLFRKPFFEFDVFMSKLEGRLDLVHQCTSAEAYVEMFKNLYNWRSSKKID